MALAEGRLDMYSGGRKSGNVRWFYTAGPPRSASSAARNFRLETAFCPKPMSARSRPMIQKPFASITMPSTVSCPTMPPVIWASARTGMLYWNSRFRSGVPSRELRLSRVCSTAQASQHSGRNWTGCYTIRPWNMHSLCWVERWSTIVPPAATTAG